MQIAFNDADRWLTENVTIITHVSSFPNSDIRVGHDSRDMRPLACVIQRDYVR